MDNTVIVVNGKPRSGKDSFSNFIVRYCDEHSVPCDVWSTIDIEKEILEEYVKPYDPNSNNDRGFLSDFKALLNEYYDYTFESFPHNLRFGIQHLQFLLWLYSLPRK